MPEEGPPVEGPAEPPPVAEDETPPFVGYLVLSDRAVDLSTGPASIEVYASAFDPSGIASLEVSFEGPEGFTGRADFGESNGSEIVEAPLAIPASAPDGDYHAVGIAAVDGAGNELALGPERLEEEGLSAEFEVYRGPDEAAPTLTGFSIDPTAIDTSAEAGSIQMQLHLSDPVSGVKNAFVGVSLANDAASEYPPIYADGAALIEGTIREGLWSVSFKLPRGAYPGEYRIEKVELEDQAGNERTYDRGELESLGFPIDFVETGEGDTTPPEILGLSHEQDVLHTRHGDRTITFLMHVRDDLSGFGEWPDEGWSEQSVSFREPGEPTSWDWTGTAPRLVSGTVLDGTWEIEVTLPEDAPAGTYDITYVSATDLAANQRLLHGSSLAGEGWDLTFENLP
jgi:hypothetical protein